MRPDTPCESDCSPAPATARPGRVCPSDYSYDPVTFDRSAEITADVLYVVGGVYGNVVALETIEALAAAEHGRLAIIFNGDFHWFDAEPDWFTRVDRAVARHHATRGNVETELARQDDIGAGCGCAYRPTVNDATVERSNRIFGDLRAAAASSLRDRLALLPMHVVAQVGPLKIAIVHGDAASLAGWRFDRGFLDDRSALPWLSDLQARSRIDVFASSHTCTAVMRCFDLPRGELTIINNGAAGMPNFSGTRFGVITRVAIRPSPHPILYGVRRGEVSIEALGVPYDWRMFHEQFLARWPEGSPAHASYFGRMVGGPSHPLTLASPRRPMVEAAPAGLS